MNAKLGIQIVGSVVIALACTNVVSAGGQLFVTYSQVPIKRLDSQTFDVLGELPGTEGFSGYIEIDRYRQYIWQDTSIYDFQGNLISQGGGGVSLTSNFEPISNSFWNLASDRLWRETYDRINVTSRREVVFPPHSFADIERNIVGSEDNVFFSLDKTIYSLDGAIVELPFTTFDLDLRTVKDGYLYFAYRPSTAAGHDIYRVREDGSDLEQLAGGLPDGSQRVESFDVDPVTETIYYAGGITETGEHLQNLHVLDFGGSTPTLICEDCAYDVDFVADDEWFQPGDTDLDHDIDITDFNALASNFNPELEDNGFAQIFKTVRQGDFNGDWRIDITDFNVLSDNFAPSGYAGPFDVPGVSAIPEPSTILLVLLALPLFGVCSRPWPFNGRKPMNAKLGSQIVGSVVIALAFTNVVSAGGSLFVTYSQVPIKRLDSQTYEVLGELPGTEDFRSDIEIDRYRQHIWFQSGRYDFQGNLISEGGGGVSSSLNFEPISNSFWKKYPGRMERQTYDRVNVTSRWEAVFSDQNPAGGTDRAVVAAEDNVFFILGKTVVSLTGEVVELPFTSFDMQLQTVKDEFLYFAYRPSTTAWHDIFRVREDGSGLEQLASGLERIESFDVDPTTETIYYTGGINTVTRSHFQNLYTLDFGDSTPTLICEDCAWDVDFVADDEWFQPGDTDLDHDIDITDFNALASNFSPELEREGPESYAFKTVRQGDFNGDWRIDITDFNVLSDNFAPSGYAGPFDVPGVSATPEPSTMLLASLALIFVGVSFRLSKNG